MTPEFVEQFEQHYRGRHRPEDVLWWLEHPEDPGPSAARPPHEAFAAAMDELAASGHRHLARLLRTAAAAAAESDRRLAEEALERMQQRTAVREQAELDPAAAQR